MTSIQIISFAYIINTDTLTAKKITGMMSVISFSMAVVDTVVDGLWVVQVRKDSKYGSNDF